MREETASIEGLPLLAPSSAGWAEAASVDIDALLIDHAHCEMKAAATGFRLLGSYPERVELVEAMLNLVREEMRHFERVRALILDRGLSLGKALPDRYVKRLIAAVGGGKLADKLIICAFVEARSCERFRLLAGLGDQLPDGLAAFYAELATAEARHHEVFLDLAALYAEGPIAERVREVGAAEAALIRALPAASAIH